MFENFTPGQRLRVVKVRPHLNHKVGDECTLVEFISYTRPPDCEVRVVWDGNDGGPGYPDRVWADQFEVVGGPW